MFSENDFVSEWRELKTLARVKVGGGTVQFGASCKRASSQNRGTNVLLGKTRNAKPSLNGSDFFFLIHL